MNRVAFKIAFIGAVVVASAAGPVVIWHWQQAQSAQKSGLLREQAVRLDKLAAENQRLSNLVAQAKSTALPEDQFRELLRLRGEIGQLHQAAGELERLRAATRQLSVAPASPGNGTGP